MRYDGPPGMMLDLVPASPDGVDLEWAHPYTYAQPYVYAKNNPVAFTDPGGLAPQKRKPKPAPPVPPQPPILCALQLCCAPLPIPCTNGPPDVFGKTACHCFVRLTGDGMVVADFHGGFGFPSEFCCGDLELTCDKNVLNGQFDKLPAPTCVTKALGSCSTLSNSR
jgi:hypothetical protein